MRRRPPRGAARPEPLWKRTPAIVWTVIGAVLASGLTVAVFNWYVGQDELNAGQVRACLDQHQLAQASPCGAEEPRFSNRAANPLVLRRNTHRRPARTRLPAGWRLRGWAAPGGTVAPCGAPGCGHA